MGCAGQRPAGSGPRGESGHSNTSPCPTWEPPNWLGEIPAPKFEGYLPSPPVSKHTRVGSPRHQKHAPPPSLSGEAGRWAPGGMEGQEPPGQFTVRRGSQGRGGDGVPCRTGDIGGRAAGHRVFGYQILAGTQPGSQGPGQGQKPLAGGTGSGTGSRPQSRCWCHQSCRHSILHTPGPSPGARGGHVPNMASVPRASREQHVQAASRAGGPADDNLFHRSYAYGTAPASESTRAFPRNKQ